jgi:hypothetical protein
MKVFLESAVGNVANIVDVATHFLILLQMGREHTSLLFSTEAVHMSLVRILMAVFDISHELEGYLLFYLSFRHSEV